MKDEGGGLFCCKSQFIPSLHMSRGSPASHLLNLFRAVEIVSVVRLGYFCVCPDSRPEPGEKNIAICHEDRKIGEEGGVLLHFDEIRSLRSLGDGAGGRP
jgi:hypothetical protein